MRTGDGWRLRYPGRFGDTRVRWAIDLVWAAAVMALLGLLMPSVLSTAGAMMSSEHPVYRLRRRPTEAEGARGLVWGPTRWRDSAAAASAPVFCVVEHQREVPGRLGPRWETDYRGRWASPGLRVHGDGGAWGLAVAPEAVFFSPPRWVASERGRALLPDVPTGGRVFEACVTEGAAVFVDGCRAGDTLGACRGVRSLVLTEGSVARPRVQRLVVAALARVFEAALIFFLILTPLAHRFGQPGWVELLVSLGDLDAPRAVSPRWVELLRRSGLLHAVPAGEGVSRAWAVAVTGLRLLRFAVYGAFEAYNAWAQAQKVGAALRYVDGLSNTALATAPMGVCAVELRVADGAALVPGGASGAARAMVMGAVEVFDPRHWMGPRVSAGVFGFPQQIDVVDAAGTAGRLDVSRCGCDLRCVVAQHRADEEAGVWAQFGALTQAFALPLKGRFELELSYVDRGESLFVLGPVHRRRGGGAYREGDVPVIALPELGFSFLHAGTRESLLAALRRARARSVAFMLAWGAGTLALALATLALVALGL